MIFFTELQNCLQVIHVQINFYSVNIARSFDYVVAVVVVGINGENWYDGAYLPYKQGFTWVGTIIPFTLSWDCDIDQVGYLQCTLTEKILGHIIAVVEFKKYVFISVS